MEQAKLFSLLITSHKIAQLYYRVLDITHFFALPPHKWNSKYATIQFSVLVVFKIIVNCYIKHCQNNTRPLSWSRSCYEFLGFENFD